MNTSSQEYIKLGESAAVKCVGGQTQYNSRFLTGESGKPNFSEGIDWVDDPNNYHGIKIKPIDACVLASRILTFRLMNGIVPAEQEGSIPCEICPYAEEVLRVQAEG
jgi:hypothetical protein